MEQQETYDEKVKDEKPPFFSRVKKLLSRSSSTNTDQEAEKEYHYKRRFLDGRIERYLDENFNNYIEEFGLVTRLDTLEYEERHDILAQRISNLKNYMQTSDAEIASLERRLEDVKKIAKKRKKKK